MPRKSNQKSEKILVFLHGWGGSSASFRSLSEQLSVISYQLSTHEEKPFSDNCGPIKIYTPDLPGFGECPTKPSPTWNTHDYAHWVDKYLASQSIDPLTQDVHFYGHSFGCRILIRWLLAHPEFKGRVILTGAAGIKWPPSLKQRLLQFMNRCLRKFQGPSTQPSPRLRPAGKSQTNSKSQTPKTVHHSPFTIHRIKSKFLRFMGAGDWNAATPELKSVLQNVLAEEDLRVYLSQISNQVLLLWGKHDTYTPLRSAKVFQSELPHAQLIVFPDGRHGIHHTHTSEIAKLVNHFLK